MSPVSSKMRIRLVIGGILVTLLLAAVFTLGSLDVPIEPRTWREVIALYAVSSFITAALLIFGLIFIRSFVRLLMERSKAQLGARFKTKMVLGAMAVSLLPIVFMFFVSYSLLNRTLGRWFPRPLEIADEAQAPAVGPHRAGWTRLRLERGAGPRTGQVVCPRYQARKTLVRKMFCDSDAASGAAHRGKRTG